jgi:hypothetical protein
MNGLVMVLLASLRLEERENAKTNFIGESESRPSVYTGESSTLIGTELRFQTNAAFCILSDTSGSGRKQRPETF